MKIFFDGGCRPNPGPIEVAIFARGAVLHATGLGEGTSEEAEWTALVHALKVARALGETDAVFIGDCANVIAQANGAKCRSPALLAAFCEKARHFVRVRVRYIRRGQNLAGIALARRHAMNRGPDDATPFPASAPPSESPAQRSARNRNPAAFTAY